MSLLSIDEVLEIAFEIFDEMVEDNLEAQELELYHQLFDEQGAAITLIPNEDWQKELGHDIDKEQFIEVQIGLAPKDQIENLLVRMLVNRDKAQKDCHLLWKRS